MHEIVSERPLARNAAWGNDVTDRKDGPNAVMVENVGGHVEYCFKTTRTPGKPGCIGE